jgi:Flp pilus assembly protein TadG
VCIKPILNKALPRSSKLTKVRGGVFIYESGAAAVEFALILPLLLVLIIGLVDFGRMGFVQVSVTAASREGARYSSLYSSGLSSTQTLVDYVQTSAPAAARVAQLDGAGLLTVAITQCSATLSSENTSVTASTNFKWLLPVGLISIVVPGATWLTDFTITSTGTMRCMN